VIWTNIGHGHDIGFYVHAWFKWIGGLNMLNWLELDELDASVTLLS